MTESEIVERCEAFAKEHGIDFAITVEVGDEKPPRRIFKDLALQWQSSIVPGSEELGFEWREKGESMTFTMRYLQHKVAIDAWLDMVAQQVKRLNEGLA